MQFRLWNLMIPAVVGWLIAGVAAEERKSTVRQLAKSASSDANHWQPPEAPAEFHKLVEDGSVTFEFYDPASPSRAYPGITYFELKYQYRSQNQFEVVAADNGKMFLVKPRWRSFDLKVTHRIELPRRLQADGFWNNPLVRHEMDHVRISAHPIWPKRFRASVEAIQKIESPMDREVTRRDLPSLARKAVDDAMQKAMDQTAELLRIRYAELDRVTLHGTVPLPDQFWESGSSN